MSMYFGIGERVERFRAFYQKNNERPLLGFYVGSDYPIFQYESVRGLPEDRPLKPSDFDPVSFAKNCRKIFELHEEYGGDFIWSASAFWGIPWVEALMGMDIYANNKTGSLYAALPKDYDTTQSFRFDRNNPWAILCRDFLTELKKESGDDFPLATTRMRGVSDLLSALYPGHKLIYEMIDNPDIIHRLAGEINNLIIDFANFQLKLIPEFHGGTGSFYYNLWAPKGTIWYQEDAVALLSPGLYDEFIRKHNEELIRSVPGCIMHQHPTGYMPYEKYLQMNFTAHEVHLDEGGPRAEELSEVYRKIQSSSCLVIWGDLRESDFDFLFSQLDKRGLAVCTMVRSKEEAEHLWNKYILKQ